MSAILRRIARGNVETIPIWRWSPDNHADRRFCFQRAQAGELLQRMYRALFTFGRFIARMHRFWGWFMAVAQRIDPINCRFFPHFSRRTNGSPTESLGSLRRVIAMGIFFKSSIRASIQAEAEQAMTGGGLNERQCELEKRLRVLQRKRINDHRRLHRNVLHTQRNRAKRPLRQAQANKIPSRTASEKKIERFNRIEFPQNV